MANERDPNEVLQGFTGDDEVDEAIEDETDVEPFGDNTAEPAGAEDEGYPDDDDELDSVLAEVDSADHAGAAAAGGGGGHGLIGGIREAIRNPREHRGRIVLLIGVLLFVLFAVRMCASGGDEPPDVATTDEATEESSDAGASDLPDDDGNWESTAAGEESRDAGEAADAAEEDTTDDVEVSEDLAASVDSIAETVDRVAEDQAEGEARMAAFEDRMERLDERLEETIQALDQDAAGLGEKVMERIDDGLASMDDRVEALELRTQALAVQVEAESNANATRERPSVRLVGTATPEACVDCSPHAVIIAEDQERQMLASGDTFEGFTVRVEADRMVLESEHGERYTYFRNY